MKKERIPGIFILLLTCVLFAACAPGSRDLRPEQEENVLTYACLDPLDNEMQNRINKFNQTHEDIQIEVLDYSDENGIQRLFTELALGRVPDIMELYKQGERGRPGDSGAWKRYNGDYWADEYWLPYRQMAQRGYLEELWPYIENDPELGREAVLEAPLKASEVDGGLYMLYKHVTIATLTGPESVVGKRCGWTLEELLETFSTMPEGSTIMRYDATRWDIYSRVLSPTLDQFIDWGAGTCSFDSEEFRTMLEFLNALPDKVETAPSRAERNEEWVHRALGGLQMLEAECLFSLNTVLHADAYFGGDEHASFVGFPTADGRSGSFFRPEGRILGMSSVCEHKEEAWDFMRQLIVRKYRSTGAIKNDRWYMKIHIPVNREDYEVGNRYDMSEGPEELFYYYEHYVGGPKIKLYPLTEEQLQRFETLMNSITRLYWPDDALSDLVWDAIGPYFAGDKTIDQVIDLVQNRAGLYVSESS